MSYKPNSRRINAPSLRWRPLFVSGIPIARESLESIADIPKKRRIEKPPRFIDRSLTGDGWLAQSKVRRFCEST